MNERITGRVVPVLRADGEQIKVTIDVARNTEFLKKYGMRILDDSALTATPSSVHHDIVEQAPKRRPMLRQEEPQVVAPLTTSEMMEQTPEVPDEADYEEDDTTEEPETQETKPTTKTRRK